MMQTTGELVPSVDVYGLGLAYFTDLTASCLAAVQSADKVYIIPSDVNTEALIKSKNPNTENLYRFYREGVRREEIYAEISDYLSAEMKRYSRCCILVYGHPTIFVSPVSHFIERASSLPIRLTVFPGVSAEDWLFAATGIDPSYNGWLSFEATNFLIYRRQADPTAYLILWQIGALGMVTYQFQDEHNSQNLSILEKYLLNFYSPSARCVAFEASPFVAVPHRIEEFELHTISEIEFSKRTTLMIYPEKKIGNRISLPDGFNLF